MRELHRAGAVLGLSWLLARFAPELDEAGGQDRNFSRQSRYLIRLPLRSTSGRVVLGIIAAHEQCVVRVPVRHRDGLCRDDIIGPMYNALGRMNDARDFMYGFWRSCDGGMDS